MKRTISIFVENRAGVLSRISGLFSRRCFNIDSLAVGVTEDAAVSRITIVADGDEYIMTQIEKQLAKLVEVKKVRVYRHDEIISRELMLVKLSVPPAKRSEIMTIADIMKAKIVDLTLTTMTLELCDAYFHLTRFEELVAPYGIIEMVRTGTVAIQKGETTLNN